MRPEQYAYIAAWGRYLGSQQDYIRAAQEKALEDHAPSDALYKQVDGTWFCRSHLPRGGHSPVAALDRDVASRRVE